jgi:cysteine desulfurase family protein
MNRDRVVYFDNAATSWPKPPQVRDVMIEYFQNAVGSPGRSGHRLSIEAGRLVLSAREAVAELFGVGDSSRIAFTKNVTEALNIVLNGWLQPGDHVITSSLEHNSVMRPLRHLEQHRGVELTVLPCCHSTGSLDPNLVLEAIRPNTRLIVMTHASNVIGNLLPIKSVGAIARAHEIPFLVDAAQTAGVVPINVEDCAIDMLAFTGHKSLLGPTGTGGLYVRPGIELPPLLRGGTGSRSELELQPDFMPDSLEAGTLNVIGLAGLAASVRFLLEYGIERVHHHEQQLVGHFLKLCQDMPHIKVYGPLDARQRIGLVSFNVDGLSPSRVALELEQSFGIMARVGLHCAPAAHKTIGTYPTGTVRFSFSIFNSLSEIDYAIEALQHIITDKSSLCLNRQSSWMD